MIRRPSSRLHRASAALAGCLLLAACGGEPVRDSVSQATIADLAARPAGQDAGLKGDARDRAIAAYYDYLQRYPASAEKTRVTRRVADLLLERAADARATIPSSPRIILAAQNDYAAAIELYQRLLAGQPGRQEDTQLRYQLARAYEESGQAARATKQLQDLVQRDAVGEDPRLYADAQFRRGELLFAEGAFQAAEQAYRAVLQLGESVPVYRQARYKLAWTLFKMARYDQALAVFFTVVDSSIPADAEPNSHLAGLSRADQEQLNDVFRGISLCFSHLGGADAVDAYFQQQGNRRYQSRVYRDLAALYVDKEFFSDAAETYLALARRGPLDPASARLYIEVIALYRRAGLSRQMRQVEAALVRDYALNPAFRTRYPLKTLPDLSLELQSSLVDLARHHHANTLDSATAADYRAAEQWYRAYLQLFPDGKQAPTMNLGLAGLYYDDGQYSQAAIQYENTAYKYGDHPAAAAAGRAALDAHARHLDHLDRAQQAAASTGATASALRFVEAFPDDAAAPAVLAAAGVQLLERKQAQQAIHESEQVLRRVGPASPLRPVAWSLLGQASYQQEDYQAAEQAYRQALSATASVDSRYPVLRKGLAASLYKQAEESRARGDVLTSSALFQRAADISSDAVLRGQARYDAAADLLAVEQWQQAIGLLEQFLADHPRHPLRQEAVRKLAYAYQNIGRHKAAAAQYLQLVSDSSDQELRREALLRAADLYQEAGSNGSAIAALERYVTDFPRPPKQLIGICQRLADLYRAEGDEGQRRRWLMRVIANYQAAAGAADDQSRHWAAQASLALAEQQSAAFQRIALVEPLQATLRAKLQALQSAIEAFERAKVYQVPKVISAANYRIANMYADLSPALLASERPDGLNAQETEQYNRLLAEQAEPFRSKAIEIHEINLRRIAEGYYDDWVEKSLQRLAQLWPLRYAKEERSESVVESLR